MMIYLFEMMIFPVRYVNYPECNNFFGVKPDHMALDTTMVGFRLVVLSSIMLRPSPHQHTSWCCSRHRRYKDSKLSIHIEVKHGKTSNLSLVLVAIIYIELKQPCKFGCGCLSIISCDSTKEVICLPNHFVEYFAGYSWDMTNNMG